MGAHRGPNSESCCGWLFVQQLAMGDARSLRCTPSFSVLVMFAGFCFWCFMAAMFLVCGISIKAHRSFGRFFGNFILVAPRSVQSHNQLFAVYPQVLHSGAHAGEIAS